MGPIVECVPNFSEGRDPEVIRQIADAAAAVAGVKVLHVDPGKATNRTVITFVGHPEAVVEAAYRATRRAGELIDMSRHKGEHPRMGATDVCPLIPVSGISMEETVVWAKVLARRVGEELGIPVYLYEAAQSDKGRSNLSVIRAGEYEGFFKKIQLPEWAPDFGPVEMDVKRGATVIGARDFLVAYNINLNTTSVRRANAIAFDVRESGRMVRSAGTEPVHVPGTLKAVKAIGWYIEEYGRAQISMNLTNLAVTSVHTAFEEVCRSAMARGIRVTGSELVGLIPLQAMLAAGKHFLLKQGRSAGVSDRELIHIAVISMGLDELAPFVPEERIIEYLLAGGDSSSGRLAAMRLGEFADETASERPAPGGGSVSAYVGALGASLGGMVANLSSHKKGWEDRWSVFGEWAEQAQAYKKTLLALVDEDTRAFEAVMAAFALPQRTGDEKALRSLAIQRATKTAIEVPFRVMEVAFASMAVIRAMAEQGNPHSVSDAGVGALCARTAVLGAFLNVRINVAVYSDKEFGADVVARGSVLVEQVQAEEAAIMAIVDGKIGHQDFY